MLVLIRKPGQRLFLSLEASLPPGLSAGRFFAGGPILVVVKRVDRHRVSLDIEAPEVLRINQEERLRGC